MTVSPPTGTAGSGMRTLTSTMSSILPQYAANLPNIKVQAVPRWKRCLDRCVIVFLLPALIPIWCLIAIYIKVVSRGPVLFCQERIGMGRQPFVCLKFRSMHPNADCQVHQSHLQKLIKNKLPMNKLDADACDDRVIPLGNVLRSSGLDELPQLINVWRGEMSIVGPRPCTLYEYQQYESWHMERFNVLPGLTGLWQVNGKNQTTFDEMLAMDIDYSRRTSLSMDMAILIKTFPVLFEQVFAEAKKKFRKILNKNDCLRSGG